MSLRKTIFYLIVFLFLFNCQKYSQNNLRFEFDYAQFVYDSSSNFIEFYYSIDKKSLTKIEKSGKLYSSAQLQLVLINSSNKDTILFEKFVLADTVITEQNLNKSSISLGLLRYVIAPAKYNLVVEAKDLFNPNSSQKLNYDITSNLYHNLSNQISEIQLAKQITSDTSKVEYIFAKNSYKVIPNPSLVYESEFSKLYYYCELYNLKGEEGELFLEQEFKAPGGRIIFHKRSPLKSNVSSKVQVGVFSIAELQSGAYDFFLSVKDSKDQEYSSTSKRFFYYSKNNGDTVNTTNLLTSYISSEFGVYSEEECDDLVNKTRYVASPEEMKQYEALADIDAKRNFLFQFWKSRDVNPATPENEYKEEIMSRINYSDQYFGSLKKNGSSTDRGRVYILNGRPDDIERYHNETGVKPYEIWEYHNIEGGVVFIFGDISGFSDFRLLHSTKRGELQQSNWLESLRGN